MFLFDFFLALAIAGLVTAAFTLLFGRRGPWASFPLFFLVIFLAAWAGGVWVTPIGPPVGGVYWLPFLVVAVLFAFLLAATTPPERPPQSRVEAWEQARDIATTALVAETFFWLLLVGLVLVIFLRYVV